jgi:hypothetical protein
MNAAAVAKQDDTEIAAELVKTMMGLANVEARLSESYVTGIEDRSFFYYRREELVMQLAGLGAGDVLERIYKSA